MTPQGVGNRHYQEPETRADAALASAARAASGTGPAFGTEDLVNLEATLDVTAVSGTSPTLDVRLETTVDGTNWDTVAAFPQRTATGQRGKAFAGLGQGAARPVDGVTTRGRRRPDVVGTVVVPDDPQPGDYWRHRFSAEWPWEWWAIVPVTGASAAALGDHDVVEHDDGTITVSPSILVDRSHGPPWHGWLVGGLWQEV